MPVARKLRKLFSLFKSDDVSRRTSGLSGVGRSSRDCLAWSPSRQESGHRGLWICPGRQRWRTELRRSFRVQFGAST